MTDKSDLFKRCAHLPQFVMLLWVTLHMAYIKKLQLEYIIH